MKELTDYSETDDAKAREIGQIDELQRALQDMHEKVSDNTRQVRTKAQHIQRAKTTVVPVNFHVGDYVTIHLTRPRHHKLNADWIEPMRILDTESALFLSVITCAEHKRI